MQLRYGRDWLSDTERALRCEWLETNGVGGFAMSTLLGIHTRRYHGLLTASLKPPVARYLLLSKYEEVLETGSHAYALSSNLYPGTTYPDGFRWLTEVRLHPFPTFRYEVAGAVLEKRVFLVNGENTAIAEWELLSAPGGNDCRLRIRPLLAFRDYHSTTHRNDAIDKTVRVNDQVITVEPYRGLPPLRFAANAACVVPVGDWYLRFQYPREQERGLDWEEDLFCPFEASFPLAPLAGRNTATIVASIQVRPLAFVPHFRETETRRRNRSAGTADEFTQTLARAADQFIVSRPGKSIIAGYPWFTDWGRDTMIALPGLTVASGRSDIARSLLVNYAAFVDEGMLPNRFPDSGEPAEYNSVDASLWYFEAVSKYLEAGNDFASIRGAVLPALREIVKGYREGTRFGIRADRDHLITSGPQLTWMDAVVDGTPVTPRAGKAVEIQALWYNALRILAELEGISPDEAEAVGASFGRQFWNGETGCFFDVVNGATRDGAIRPNQVLALSLTYPIAKEEQARLVLAKVTEDLLTPFGLRTLSPQDSHYKGQCTGGPAQRDAAYHQGTVWPWLLGPYVAAARRFGFPVDGVLDRLREYALGEGGGQIPEIFDGNLPHTPRGCPAQAWSVGEILRAWAMQ